jgi:hypothetical protein
MLPPHPAHDRWQLVIDTTQELIPARAPLVTEGTHYDLKGRSLAVMQISTVLPIKRRPRRAPAL